MRALRKWLLLTAFAAAPLPAFGQVCGGFPDVDPSEFYCSDVEWIKNRGVTNGCFGGTAFCDTQNLIRGEMAAFLRRLGRVLTPLVLRANDSATGQTYASPFVLCESTVVEPATPPYNRQASFTATVMNFNASATKTVQGRLVYSTSTPPAPPVWTPTGDAVMWQTVDPGERTTLALTGGPLDLAPSQHYQFAISLDTNAIGATVDAECQLNVRIDNRNSATSPL